ncbi:hypothetical protein PSPTOT1_4153 [Pseudomonas syringae pv. tomato T1]|nr:hypothetical protein PSPTOT1_4153 [Pseudomonas syringae pv. tomato T1]
MFRTAGGLRGLDCSIGRNVLSSVSMPGELFTKASGWQRPGLANVDDYLPWLLGTVESIAEQRSWLSVAFLMLQITTDWGGVSLF